MTQSRQEKKKVRDYLKRNSFPIRRLCSETFVASVDEDAVVSSDAVLLSLIEKHGVKSVLEMPTRNTMKDALGESGVEFTSVDFNQDVFMGNIEDIDMVLIDATHSYERVCSDSKLAREIIGLRDGIIVWNNCDFTDDKCSGRQYIEDYDKVAHRLYLVEEAKVCFEILRSPLRYECGSNICVISSHTGQPNWDELGEFSAYTKREYCVRKDFDLRIHTHSFDPTRPAAWSKLLFVRQALEKYEYVFWLDSDAAITNLDLDIRDIIDESNGVDLIISEHQECGLFTAAFILRSSSFADSFIQEIWKNEGFDFYPCSWEQRVVNKMYDDKLLDGHIKVLPMRTLISLSPYVKKTKIPKCDKWIKGDFSAHCGGRLVTIEDRLKGIRRCYVESNELEYSFDKEQICPYQQI